MKSSLRAFLFDFDGVIADSEPIHLAMFQKVLTEEGLSLDRETYYEKYLGLDDRSFFEAFYKENGNPLSREKNEDLILRKNQLLLSETRNKSLLLPGVRAFLEQVKGKYYFAIVSGALRNEIEAILNASGLSDHFQVIVGADDVSEGKPHPEGFLQAIRLLNRDFVPASEILLPEECLAIDDSPWGLTAARKAGAKCLAVETSYPKEKLTEADLVISNLLAARLEELEKLF